jgi:hypothetical protein
MLRGEMPSAFRRSRHPASFASAGGFLTVFLSTAASGLSRGHVNR